MVILGAYNGSMELSPLEPWQRISTLRLSIHETNLSSVPDPRYWPITSKSPRGLQDTLGRKSLRSFPQETFALLNLRMDIQRWWQKTQQHTWKLYQSTFIRRLLPQQQYRNCLTDDQFGELWEILQFAVCQRYFTNMAWYFGSRRDWLLRSPRPRSRSSCPMMIGWHYMKTWLGGLKWNHEPIYRPASYSCKWAMQSH